MPPVDTISMSSRQYYRPPSTYLANNEHKCKYNTLTPAEAKRLTRTLSGHHNPVARLPLRNASVYTKPRPPPRVPTSDLNSTLRQHDSDADKSEHDNVSLSDVLQALSVDFNKPTSKQTHYPYYGSNSMVNRIQQADGLSNSSKMMSEDSFCSAKSRQSSSDHTASLNSKNKLTLSQSTQKVFQSPLHNLKKFFSHIPLRRSFMGVSGSSSSQQNTQQQQQQSTSIGTLDSNELNKSFERSQSPTILPPPPGDLKSMSYMANSNLYSNYDEFTRVRNQKTHELLLNKSSTHDANRSSLIDNRQSYKGGNATALLSTVDDFNNGEASHSGSWQMASLPVNFKKNLSTVFEERQHQSQTQNQKQFMSPVYNETPTNECHYVSFGKQQPHAPKTSNQDIKVQNLSSSTVKNATETTITDSSNSHVLSSTNSSQSLTSINTSDSVLEFHRQTAASFRFTYAQPNSSFQQISTPQKNFIGINNNGLPPKIPISEPKLGSSGHGSSNTSSSIENVNRLADCDKISLTGFDMKDFSQHDDSTDEVDTTIVANESSNSLAIHQQSQQQYSNAGGDNLIRLINELRNELAIKDRQLQAKDKELTDTQLKVWSSDYQNESLKTTISKLEKENAQLKAMVVKFNRLQMNKIGPTTPNLSPQQGGNKMIR